MANTIDVNSVLNQIRAIRQEVSTPLEIQRDIAADMRSNPIGSPAVERSGQNSFAAMLQQSVGAVNEAQKTSASLSEAFVRGDPNVTLPEVMVAGQKAEISFTAAMEVRNKFIDAYQEVMRMSV